MSDRTPLSPVEATAWRSLVVLWRVGLPRLDQTFKRHGLIHLEYGILAVLSEREDRAMAAGELAELAGVTTSRMSHRLRAMEEKGDIERRPSPGDARGVTVIVTDQGLQKVRSAWPEHLDDVRSLVFDRLTAEQTAALSEALAAIARPLTEHPFIERRPVDS